MKNVYLCSMMDEQTKKLKKDYLRYLRLQRNMSTNTLDAYARDLDKLLVFLCCCINKLTCYCCDDALAHVI